MPEITVVIPSYNQSEFIEDAIESVLGQGFKDFELIIIDCSDNDTWKIIDTFTDKRIKKLQVPFNKMADKLNQGFEMAKGKYLTWLCSDDILKPEFLQIMYDKLESDKDIDFVYADYSTLRASCKEWREDRGSENATVWKGNAELYRNNHCGIFWLFKKEVFDKVGNFDKCSAEDYDYLLRLSEGKYKMVQMPMKLACYREHPGQSVARLNMGDVRKLVLLKANKRGNYGQEY